MAKNTKKAQSRNPMLAIALVIIVLGASAFGLYVFFSEQKSPVIIPTNNTQQNNTIPEPVKVIVCDHDKVCDEGENIEDCAYDCVPSTGLSAVRSNESSMVDTTPTVTIRMQDADGIQSCGTSATDSTQWDCIVKEPGATVTDVDCTLKNYGLDGVYMLILRCKNGNGNDVTPVMMDGIIICADPLGCKR